MPINLYVCPTFQEESSLEIISQRVLSNFHPDKAEREYFENLLSIVNESSFPVAIVEGILKDLPMDPREESWLMRKSKGSWVAFSPKEKERWQILEHKQYMALPYHTRIEPVTPLYIAEVHVRKYLGERSTFLKYGEIQKMNAIRFDDGRTGVVDVEIDEEKVEKLLLKKNLENRDQLSSEDLLSCSNFIGVETSKIPHMHPRNISSGHIRKIRDKLLENSWHDSRIPNGWTNHGIHSFGWAHLTETDDLAECTLGGYYTHPIEFLDMRQILEVHSSSV